VLVRATMSLKILAGAPCLFLVALVAGGLVACGGRHASVGGLESDTDTDTDEIVPVEEGSSGSCTEPPPACDVGDVAIAGEAECPPGATCYARSTRCAEVATTTWCATPACESQPKCDVADIEVGACPTVAECYPRTSCGRTILCARERACRAVPTCDDGDAEKSSLADCEKTGLFCYSRSECGTVIWCASAP
jgi:hypothetical protein